MYVIKNVETDNYVSTVVIGRSPYVHPVMFSPYIGDAIHFESADEANSAITFIGDVIDWELEQLLIIVSE